MSRETLEQLIENVKLAEAATLEAREACEVARKQYTEARANFKAAQDAELEILKRLYHHNEREVEHVA